MAASTSSPPPTPPARPVPLLRTSAANEDDWPRQATDAIVRVVDSVRDKTSGRAVTAAAIAVYGLVIAPVVAVVGILLTIVWFRVCERVAQVIADLIGFDHAQPMWAVYLVHGAIFSVVGLLLWRKRNATSPAS